MSSLDKLAIRGIRSFDSQEYAVMQFYTPLTVIVGHNGSGKTTIIECLKYAATGDLPPGAKGGAFIHDPAISGAQTVMAQVKLRFNNVRKEKMLVERRLQVTKKKTASGLSMKTLEGVISYADNEQVDKKKRQTLSTKCANIDEEVPAQLGVSRAILQNVIFCHQEESNWPLSEPAALKKKFDDIFEASDYTKVLDEIKRIRKEQTVDIKVDKEKLSALKTDRDRAFKLRENLKKVSSQIAIKQANFDELEGRIAKLVADNKSFFNQASKYQDIISKVETLRDRRKMHEDNLNDLLTGLRELPDSEQELRTKIDNHEADVEKMRGEREGTKNKLADEQDALAVYERKRSAAQTSHGRLLALKQRHQDLLEARKTLIRELSEKHEIPGYDHDLSDHEMQAFEEKLEDTIHAQQKKLEKIKNDARSAEGKLQDRIQDLKSKRAADERAKENIAAQIRAAQARIASVSRQLDATSATVADISLIKSDLDEARDRKKKIEDQVKTSNFTQQLRDKAREGKELEEQRDALHAGLAGLNTQANTRAKLQLRRYEKKRKEEAMHSLIDKNAGSFRRLLNSDPRADSMEAEVSAVIETHSREVDFAERAAKDAARELQNVESSVDFSRKRVRDLTEKSQAAHDRIAAALKGMDVADQSFKEALSEAEKELDHLVTRHGRAETDSPRRGSEIAGARSIETFYDSVLLKANRSQVCLGCNRGVSHEELPALEQYVKRKKQQAPEALRGLEEQRDDWQQQLDTLKALAPTEAVYQRLVKEELPAAKDALTAEEEKLAPARDKAKEQADRLTEVKDASRDLQTLKRAASDVLRLFRECEDVDREVAKLESELSATGSTATTEEIQDKLSALADHIRLVKTSTDKIRQEQQSATSSLQSLSESIHAREMELAKKEQELKDKEALERSRKDARDEIGMLEGQTKDLDKRLNEAIAPIRAAESELSTLRADFTRDETAASRQLQAYNKSVEQLDLNKREIRSVISDAKKRFSALQTQIARIDQNQADSKAILRGFQDNLRVRIERRALKDIEDEIETLDEHGARNAYVKFETQYNEQRKKQTELQSEQARLGGEVQTLEADEKEKREELATEYKDIEEKYRRELITLKTAEMANQDLEKLQKALDGAIMRFHGLKMKEINDTIADLWTKTYQGTDIDKIMIKSDSEGKTTGAARSYNYRVVMFKDTNEMDMRGRCSAGQKVLASIIIRLALAESFSLNCGVMALDEPTTNLDHDNIQALAASLNELIKERRAQSNFQLIVITHDEGFLETLGGSGVLDKYWRVSRGDGGQVSTIERQRLS
ncbi:DNA repair protein RAD50 [Rhodotorula taiwanensis]|uniref:DNA repair protein RAD50 n=1 Tax=Rhodotorula taiwanensis TaxID=741276 RepID=A0A2S5B5G4_9BASI|nr:DNA repair protein RAD50 [Rhodotorula taiwanensis]